MAELPRSYGHGCVHVGSAEPSPDVLARSSAAFVWAARTGTTVPDGFEAGTASRGLVIRGWAPQVEVLCHRAVGWNSVLEEAVAGVVMLAWPMGADQFTDARQHGGTRICAEVAQPIG